MKKTSTVMIWILFSFLISSFLLQVNDSTKIAVTDSLATMVDSSLVASVNDQPDIEKGLPTNEQLIAAILLLLVAFVLIHFLSRAIEAITKNHTLFRMKSKRLTFIFKIFAWMVVIYIAVIEVLDLPYLSYLLILAFVLLIIGLSIRDLARNVLGGILIFLDKPFKVGDRVTIEGYYGEILNIELRNTMLLTRDNKYVTIPNANISREVVANANKGELSKKIITDFYLPMAMDTQALKNIATRAVSVSRYAYLVKPVEVIFKNEIHEGKPFLKMTVIAYVSDLRYEEAFSSEITELVMDYLLKNNRSEILSIMTNS